jgi:hypothetical protein
VLGISAITWIPYVVEKKILPLFKVENRPAVAFTLLWALLMAYLPMMYYSRASYLTGAFLAGLSFGQVEGVHHTFVQEAGVIMDWLLRIFFAASIGFQVPIKMFGSSHVVAWGFAFYTAVLGKLPVGLFAPKYVEETPKDYPFNPYVRDVVITSVAMTCRGEFSFIIAAFGIGEGLLDPELYSSIIFAVLLSSITSPIMLTVILKYYNKLALRYLERDQLDKSEVGGRAPLHVNIQIRSSVVPGMQQSIKHCVNSLGLFVIDQRSWNPRGLAVVVATELYCVDSKTMIDVAKSLKKVDSMEASAPRNGESTDVVVPGNETGIPEDSPVVIERDFVADRCEEIRLALLNCPELVNASVKVLHWVPLADALGKHVDKAASADGLDREAKIVNEVAASLKNKETIETLVDETPDIRKKRYRMLSGGPLTSLSLFGEAKQEADAVEESSSTVDEFTARQPEEVGLMRRPRRMRMVSSPAVGGSDLWGQDIAVQNAALHSFAPAVQYDTNSGIRYGVARRQRMPSDLGAIMESAPTVEERLGGIVRHSIGSP